MGIGIVLAAAVATCAPTTNGAGAPGDVARTFFRHVDARDYAAALRLVVPGAPYVERRSGEESPVEDLLAQLADGGDSVSRIQFVEQLTIPGVAAARTRVLYPREQPFEQISVLVLRGGCIAEIHNYEAR